MGLGLGSIREFCPLEMPIFMYDKYGNYIVKTLEEVSCLIIINQIEFMLTVFK